MPHTKFIFSPSALQPPPVLYYIINLLLHLIYTLHFIIGMYVSKNLLFAVYRTQYYLQFQAPTGGFGTYPVPTVRGA